MAKTSPKSDSPAPKKTATAVKRRKVALAVLAPQASKAAVAGTFNDWQPQPLKPADAGLFSLTLLLPPGDYEYRFVVDGEWRSDSACPEAVPNPFGESNSLLHVA